jgi:dihydroflavonol-4-reductase
MYFYQMVLVTGGTGLVGSHLLFDLCKKGCRVRALKRSNSDMSPVKSLFAYYNEGATELFSSIEWVEGDILDIAALEDSLEGVSSVYHCAAMISFNPDDQQEMLRVNVEGTANLVNACLHKGIKRLCHVSSIATLGRNSVKGLITEETHWKTSPENTWYAISKYGAEREVWRGAEEGLEIVVVNPSVIVGPGDWNKSSLVMFQLAARGLKYYTTGQTGYVDVRDVSEIMIRLMDKGVKGNRYILNAENIPFRVFFDWLLEIFNKPKASIKVNPLLGELGWRFEKILAGIRGKKPRITKETARAANLTYEFSSDKIKKELDYEFIPVHQSVKDACAYYKKATSF